MPIRLKVLVVDDEPGFLNALKQAIVSWGHECRTANDGLEALEMNRAVPADVIVSDWQMPRMDGLELCKQTRTSEGLAYTHFIFVTSLGDRDHFLLGMQAGADDYMNKPVDLDELRARLTSAARVVAVHRELASMNSVLRRDSQVSFRLARVDALTGAGNRLRLEEDLGVLWAQTNRYERRSSAVLCDIDWFKAYNDHFGHIAGDAALRAVAETIRGELRASDTLYRYGGEEFLILLPEQSAEQALGVAERVRRAVEQRAIPTIIGAGVVTISAGVAELDQLLDADVIGWLRRTDDALYGAKSGGRNRTEAHGGGTTHVAEAGEPRHA